ncbi:MAG: hypothetical protein V3U99_04655, partial [Alphaproteobacteria bacterium]
ISEEEKKSIEDTVQDLKTALEGEDQADIQAKTEALAHASMKLGEAIYKAAQEAEAAEASDDGAAATAGDGGAVDDDKVVDADFQEVDDDPPADTGESEDQDQNKSA